MYLTDRTVLPETTAHMKGTAVKKLNATSVAGLIVVVSTMAPAQASTCEASTQTVTRTAGAWSSMSGPIVTATVDQSGVSWTVGPDAALEQVMLEYAPTTINGATVSSAVALPGSDTGTMSIEGDGDVVVRFVGSSCLDDRSNDAVVEVVSDQSAPTVSAEPVSTAQVSVTVAPAEVVDQYLSVRRLCWFAKHYPI